jgi:hypothetical protein
MPKLDNKVGKVVVFEVWVLMVSSFLHLLYGLEWVPLKDHLGTGTLRRLYMFSKGDAWFAVQEFANANRLTRIDKAKT